MDIAVWGGVSVLLVAAGCMGFLKWQSAAREREVESCLKRFARELKPGTKKGR